MSETLPSRLARQTQSLFGLTPLRTLRGEMDDLMNRYLKDWSGEWLPREFSPSCDLSETADAFQIRVDVPGIKPEDISIEVSGNNIRICGERKAEKEEKGKTFHRVERHCGKFTESLSLPCSVKDDKVHAEFEDGVLTVTLPKTEAAKTHKVHIKAIGNGGAKK